MINYRVYIKQAKNDILPGLKTGALNSNDGSEQVSSAYYISTDFIKVDNRHHYELVKINNSANIIYYVCEYDQNKTYIGPRSIKMQEINGNAKDGLKPVPSKYVPTSSNVSYIKFQIDEYTEKEKYMFLESSHPHLIHDSNSPDAEMHLNGANLHLEECSAGTFEFVIWPGHSYYQNKINLFTDTIYVTRIYKNGSERIIWDGRPISEESDIEYSRSYHCEGALSYFNDMMVIPGESAHSISVTIKDFIDDYLVRDQNYNNKNNKMDRGNFESRFEVDDIFVQNPPRNFEWDLRGESGMVWLNNIKESFGFKYKIRYPKNYNITEDSIKKELITIYPSDSKVKIYNCNGFIKKTYEKGTIIYFVPDESHMWLSGFYRFNKRVKNIEISTIQDFPSSYTSIGVLSPITPEQNGFEIVSKKYNYAILKPHQKRFSKLNAEFGLNVFGAKKSISINDTPTVIVPKGVEWEDEGGNVHNVYLTSTSRFDKTVTPPTTKTFNVSYSSPYITDFDLVKQYGYIEATVDFPNALSPSQLKDQAEEWFSKIKKTIASQSIEISLSDLGDNTIIHELSDDKLVTDPEYVDIWTVIRASIPQLGITKEDPEIYYVSSMDIPLDDYLNTQLGLVGRSSMISNNTNNSGNFQSTSSGIIDTLGG